MVDLKVGVEVSVAEADGEGVAGFAVLPGLHAESAIAMKVIHPLIGTCSCRVVLPRI